MYIYIYIYTHTHTIRCAHIRQALAAKSSREKQLVELGPQLGGVLACRVPPPP